VRNAVFRDITKQISIDQHYTNIDWCRCQHWKILPRSYARGPKARG